MANMRIKHTIYGTKVLVVPLILARLKKVFDGWNEVFDSAAWFEAPTLKLDWKVKVSKRVFVPGFVVVFVLDSLIVLFLHPIKTE